MGNPNTPERDKQAKFFVVEGIDGSGSTTQTGRLVNHFRGKGRPAIATHEPSQGPVGMLIRLALAGRLKGTAENSKLHDDSDNISTELDKDSLALLFAADRRDHIAATIQPALRKGRHVVSDRYLLSTLAYQGLYADVDWLLEINARAISPDLTIYLDVPLDKAQARIHGVRWTEDLYETMEYQEKVLRNYRHLAEKAPAALGPIVRIDAGQGDADAVHNHIKKIVSTYIHHDEIIDTGHQLELDEST